MDTPTQLPVGLIIHVPELLILEHVAVCELLYGEVLHTNPGLQFTHIVLPTVAGLGIV